MAAEFDEAHVCRLLKEKIEAHGGVRAAANAMGISENSLYQVIGGRMIIPDSVAKGVGYRRKFGGRLSRSHRPLRFVRIENGSSTTGERK